MKNAASAVTTVGAIVFHITDLDRTEAFYRDALGVALDRIPGEHHGDFLMGSAGPVQLVFFASGGEAVGRSPIVVFHLESGIEAAVESLVAHNVEVVSPVTEAPGGGLTADFLDPDGHVLSYYQDA
jgi:predicted enzyme related to lactoylglutathione lyase